MIKAITTKNSKPIADMIGGNYCIEGVVKEDNRKHAEYRFWFEAGKDWPTLVIRTRCNFNKRFSCNNQRIHKFIEYYFDPKDTNKLIEVVMNDVYNSRDKFIESEFLNGKI